MARSLSDTLRDLALRFPPDLTVDVHSRDIDSGEPKGEHPAPRFLYRGEADATWDSLMSSMERLRNSKLSPEDKTVIETVAADIDHHLRNRFGLSKQRSAGFLQHYGLPTELIDVSSSLPVAALFSVCGNTSGSGAITVFDTLQVTRNCSLVDLTSLDFASRPTTQAGYGVFHRDERNLRASKIAASIQLARYEFKVGPADVARCVTEARDVYRSYIDPRDPARAVLGHLLMAYTRKHGGFNSTVAAWLASRIPPSLLTVVDHSSDTGELSFRERSDLPNPCDVQAIVAVNALQWLSPH